MRMPIDTYIPDETFNQLKSELVRLIDQGPSSNFIDVEGPVVQVLGEVGGVWPESISARNPEV